MQLACLTENFGSRTEGTINHKLALGNRTDRSGSHIAHGAKDKLGTKVHETVMDSLCIIVWKNWHSLAIDDLTRINVVVEEKGGDARLGVAINDCPVDGGSTTILRQEGGMEVECTKARHGPNHLGEHAEGYNHLKVCFKSTKLTEELLVTKTFWLQDRNVMAEGKLLDRALLQDIVMTAHWFIWHGDASYDVTTCLKEGAKGFDCKVGRTHIYDAKRIHKGIKLLNY